MIKVLAYATVAYEGSTGSELWVQRYDGPAGANDTANGLAVGPGGDVFVTGGSQGTGTSSDFATVAYAG